MVKRYCIDNDGRPQFERLVENKYGPLVKFSDYDAIATRLAEAEARYQRVMAVIRPLCAKYAPDLLAEFDAATASTVANSGDEANG